MLRSIPEAIFRGNLFSMAYFGYYWTAVTANLFTSSKPHTATPSTAPGWSRRRPICLMDDPCEDQRAITDTEGPSYCKISWSVTALRNVARVVNLRFFEALVNCQSDLVIHIANFKVSLLDWPTLCQNDWSNMQSGPRSIDLYVWNNNFDSNSVL